jgi:RND family efflux transporter MFP subunit
MLLHTILTRVRAFFATIFKKFIRFGKKFGWVKVTVGILALIIIGWTLVHMLSGKPQEVALNETRTVTLKSVAELSSESTPLEVAGTVSSKSQAQVRAEAGGQITAVNYSLGDYVQAGAIIASTENASQRAAVAQAQGAVSAASAGASVSQTGLASAKNGGVTALLSAYATVDKIVRADLDPMFSNPETSAPIFNVQSSDSQAKINAENARVAFGQILKRQASVSGTITSSSNLIAELETAQKELRSLRDFLDIVLKVLNAGISTNTTSASAISGYIATANADRSAAVGALASLAQAESSIQTAQTGAELGTGTSAAALAQAEAGLAAARAALEKTIVRAPISGSINSLSLKVGDYLAPGTIAVVIANNGALEITSYVTATDAQEITAGTTVQVEIQGGSVGATVTRIAPAIDPQTKKIEVRIGITKNADLLLNGQSVTVSIPRIQKNTAAARITLPLSALKVGADSISVFTADENKKLVAHPVTLGQLLGDRVVIESGVTGDMQVVTDARGLQPGQTVNIQ